MAQMGKSRETASKLRVAWGWGKWGVTANGAGFLLWVDGKVSKWTVVMLPNSVNILLHCTFLKGEFCTVWIKSWWSCYWKNKKTEKENLCLKNFSCLPYDPASPLLGIYPEKTVIQKDTRTPVLTAAKTQKQPKCSSIEEWIKKMCCVCVCVCVCVCIYIYIGILLSRKKEWNCAVCRDTDGPRDSHTEWNKKEKHKCCILTRIYGI